MKNIILIAIIISSLMFCFDDVIERYSNGMPKVVKVYSTSYGKLNLTKETGYYSDGSQEYQKTYYKGKLQSFYEWDNDGNKIKRSWYPYELNEAIDLCRKRTDEHYEKLKIQVDEKRVYAFCDCYILKVSYLTSYSIYRSILDFSITATPEEEFLFQFASQECMKNLLER